MSFRLILALLLAVACAFGQPAPIPQQLTFHPYHVDGVYDVGETVGWTVAPGPVSPTYAYKWTIRRNNAVVLKQGKLDLSPGKDKSPRGRADNAAAMAAALYFDPVNFASRLKAPVMAGIGLIDTISLPAGIWTALNQVSAPVEPLLMVESEHDNLRPQKARVCPARTTEILDALRSGELRPR